MKRISEKTVRDTAAKALAAGNPYRDRAVRFMIGRKERYIFSGKIMTGEEIDHAYLETAVHDIRRGYSERAAGYYDKFYRYTRADEGRAYDLGCMLAVFMGCAGEMTVIPYTV